jgi:hypothetical protein
MALLTPAVNGSMPFGHHQRVGRPVGPARLELLTEGHLLFAQSRGAMYRGPTWSRVAAAQKFLVFVLMA